MTLPSADFAPSDAPARRPWHPLSLLLVLALWLSTAGNLPLWRALWTLTDNHNLRSGLGLLGFGLIVMAATTVLLSLLIWPRWRKPVGVLLLLVAAGNSYFMHTYGVVIDPTMMANTVQTDVREVRDLLSWSLLAVLALGVVLPGWWWWRQPVQQLPTRRLLGRQLGLAGLALLLMLVVIWASFQDLASTMRNHKSLRYMLNPFNTIYASTRLVVGQSTQARMPLQTIGEDASLVQASGASKKSPLIVLVVGETVRAANFGLGGYERDTTPLLRQLQGSGELATLRMSLHAAPTPKSRCRACFRIWVARRTPKTTSLMKTCWTFCSVLACRCCGWTTSPAAKAFVTAYRTPAPVN